MLLNGKKALVTGSSRGIGLGIVELLLENGVSVVANSRNEMELKKVYANQPHVFGVAADVTDARAAEHLVNRASEHLTGIDLIVCNVGSGRSVPPGEESVSEWHRVFDTNFFSVINVIEAYKPIAKSGCSIICISSICGNEAIPGAPVCYSTAKAALNSYVNLISRPFAKKGVRVNAVSPGNVFFDGSVWHKKMRNNPDETLKIIEREVPMAAFVTPQDVAEAVLWLASDQSKFVTGTVLTVDGGQTRNN